MPGIGSSLNCGIYLWHTFEINDIMDKLVDLFTKAMQLRLNGNVAHAQLVFQQYREQATLLGKFSPQHLLIYHLMFEADLSSVTEMWQSSAKVMETSLEMCEFDDQMINRLEILTSLTQIYIYLREPNQASLYLGEAWQVLEKFEQGELNVRFSEWDSVILQVKGQILESLRQQIELISSDDSLA